MKHQIKYALDVQTKTSVYERTVTQNDTIEFVITMLMGGEKMDLTGVTPSLAVKRLDGTVTVLEGTVDGNVITFNLGSSETAKPGRTQAVVQLYDANGRVSSLPFSFCVSADFTAAGFTPSENERTLIEVVLQDGPGVIDRATDAASLAERVAAQNETHPRGIYDTEAARDAAIPDPLHGDTATVANETTGISTTYRYVDATVDDTVEKSGWIPTERLNNPSAIRQINQQLAETSARKADKIELARTDDTVSATNKRIDELIIGSGNANAEVTDSHVSLTKNKTFGTLANRLEDTERDIENFGNFKIENKIKNGDFSKGLEGWEATTPVTVVNGEAKISIQSGISFRRPVNFITGHKYYFSVLHRAENVTASLSVTLRKGTTLTMESILFFPSGTTALTRFDKIFTVTTDSDSFGFSRGGTSAGFHVVDKVMVVDLTEAFGAGKEPKTTAEIRDWISMYGDYFEGTKRIGNREFVEKVIKDIQSNNQTAQRNIYEELRGNIYQRDFRVDKMLKTADAVVSAGDVTLTDVSDAVVLKNNTTAVKMTVNSPTNVRIDFPLSKPIDLYKRTFALNFYLPPESGKTPRQAKFSVLAVYLTTPAGNYIIYPESPDRRYPGWNAIIGNPFNADLSSVPEEHLTNVTNIRIHLNTDATITEPYDIYFDSLTSWNGIRKPTVLLEFDDAFWTVYANAFPLMAERGMRGATHRITKHIANPDPSYCTNDQIKRMHDVGWDICSHSVNHEYISTLTEEQQLFELEQSHKDLLNEGLKHGPQFYIAPYGDNTLYAVDQARRFYQNYRMTGYRPAQPVLPVLPYAMETINAGSRGLSGIKSLIDKAAERGGHLPLMWHGEIGETWGGVKWEVSEFRDMLDYLIEKKFSVVTYSDMFPGTSK